MAEFLHQVPGPQRQVVVAVLCAVEVEDDHAETGLPQALGPRRPRTVLGARALWAARRRLLPPSQGCG